MNCSSLTVSTLNPFEQLSLFNLNMYNTGGKKPRRIKQLRNFGDLRALALRGSPDAAVCERALKMSLRDQVFQNDCFIMPTGNSGQIFYVTSWCLLFI